MTKKSSKKKVTFVFTSNPVQRGHRTIKRRVVTFTAAEFEALECLLSRPGAVFYGGRGMLVDKVGG